MVVVCVVGLGVGGGGQEKLPGGGWLYREKASNIYKHPLETLLTSRYITLGSRGDGQTLEN